MNSTEYLYGINVAREVLKAGRRKVYKALIARSEKNPAFQEVLYLLQKQKIEVEEVDRPHLEKICLSPQHQGVVLKTDAYPYIDFEDLKKKLDLSKPQLLLALDQIQDPHNVGALLRSAEGVGVSAVLIPERESALINATVLKTSSGAAEYLQICLVKNLARALEELKEIPFWIYGAEGEAAQNYNRCDYASHAVLVMGSEGTGLRRLVKEKCDALVSIPLAGKLDSLNVSAAGAVLLFEMGKKLHV